MAVLASAPPPPVIRGDAASAVLAPAPPLHLSPGIKGGADTARLALIPPPPGMRDFSTPSHDDGLNSTPRPASADVTDPSLASDVDVDRAAAKEFKFPPFHTVTIPVLKGYLRSFKLRLAGNKSELYTRLHEYLSIKGCIDLAPLPIPLSRQQVDKNSFVFMITGLKYASAVGSKDEIVTLECDTDCVSYKLIFIIIIFFYLHLCLYFY